MTDELLITVRVARSLPVLTLRVALELAGACVLGGALAGFPAQGVVLGAAVLAAGNAYNAALAMWAFRAQRRHLAQFRATMTDMGMPSDDIDDAAFLSTIRRVQPARPEDLMEIARAAQLCCEAVARRDQQ